MGGRRCGKRKSIYLSIHCHHQNDPCIKMGSDESHFNVSLYRGTKSQDSVHKPQLLKRRESRSGIEPRSFRLPAYRLTARPNRLSRTLPAQHTTFNTLDNWAIKPPPNQKGKGQERKGYRVMARTMYTTHSVTSWIIKCCFCVVVFCIVFVVNVGLKPVLILMQHNLSVASENCLSCN